RADVHHPVRINRTGNVRKPFAVTYLPEGPAAARIVRDDPLGPHHDNLVARSVIKNQRRAESLVHFADVASHRRTLRPPHFFTAAGVERYDGLRLGAGPGGEKTT